MNEPRSLAGEFDAWCSDFEEHLRRWPWNHPQSAEATAAREALMRRKEALLERIRNEE